MPTCGSASWPRRPNLRKPRNNLRGIKEISAPARYRLEMSRIALAAGIAGLTVFASAALAQGALGDVRAVMQQEVNPAMLAIWDVTNNAMDDEGGIDPKQMDAAKWAAVAEQADKLAAAGAAMAAMGELHASATDNAEVAEGEVTMAAVQKALDANPDAFRALAATLVEQASQLAAASRARDAAKTGALVSEMDAVCESCHIPFWYPEEG